LHRGFPLSASRFRDNALTHPHTHMHTRTWLYSYTQTYSPLIPNTYTYLRIHCLRSRQHVHTKQSSTLLQRLPSWIDSPAWTVYRTSSDDTLPRHSKRASESGSGQRMRGAWWKTLPSRCWLMLIGMRMRVTCVARRCFLVFGRGLSCALLCVAGCAGCAGCAGGDGYVRGLRSRPVMYVYMYTYVCLWKIMVDWYSWFLLSWPHVFDALVSDYEREDGDMMSMWGSCTSATDTPTIAPLHGSLSLT
jgi:hypothetical protein